MASKTDELFFIYPVDRQVRNGNFSFTHNNMPTCVLPKLLVTDVSGRWSAQLISDTYPTLERGQLTMYVMHLILIACLSNNDMKFI